MVTIYALRDPRTEEIKYIGSTSDAEQRKTAHVSACRSGRRANSLTQWFSGLRESGMVPEFVSLLEVNEEDRVNTENEYINRYSQSGYLLNARPAHRPPMENLKAEKAARDLLTIYEASQYLGKPFVSDDIRTLVNRDLLRTYKIGKGITQYVKRSDLCDADRFLLEIEVAKKERAQRESERNRRALSIQQVTYIWLSANGPDWKTSIPQVPLQYRQQQETLVPTF